LRKGTMVKRKENVYCDGIKKGRGKCVTNSINRLVGGLKGAKKEKTIGVEMGEISAKEAIKSFARRDRTKNQGKPQLGGKKRGDRKEVDELRKGGQMSGPLTMGGDGVRTKVRKVGNTKGQGKQFESNTRSLKMLKPAEQEGTKKNGGCCTKDLPRIG